MKFVAKETLELATGIDDGIKKTLSNPNNMIGPMRTLGKVHSVLKQSSTYNNVEQQGIAVLTGVLGGVQSTLTGLMGSAADRTIGDNESLHDPPSGEDAQAKEDGATVGEGEGGRRK